ncbi:hypothetical protein HanIR_Chr11g0534881 [Helianthus annuus]|nr:hypothetical protein HanIR_Chr11g0534881 [Helianthus annuus]
MSAGHDPVCRSVSVLSRFAWILRILALTTTVLSWAHPRVENRSFYSFVFSADTWPRPRVRWARGRGQPSILLFLLGKILSRGRAYHVYSFSCIYVRFGCIFVPFVQLSSFSPENTKIRQKHTFSNISTKKC